MLVWIAGGVAAVVSGLLAYYYFKPPGVTPISKETLDHLARLQAKEGFRD